MASTDFFKSRGFATEELEKCETESTDSLLDGKSDTSRLDLTHAPEKYLFLFKLWLSLLVMSTCSFFAGSAWQSSKIPREVFDMSSIRSPVKKDLSPATNLVKFEGVLGWDSKYRGTSPEVDAAWKSLTNYTFFSISRQDVIDIGASLDAIQLPEHMGGGYLASSELAHKFHCLDFIRRSLFTNIDYYRDKSPELTNRPEVVKEHLEHCVEMFRQDTMCTADPGVLTSHWVKGYPHPYTNFNVWKVCRNWEDVLDWAGKKQIREQAPDDTWNFIRKEDATVWSEPPSPNRFNSAPSFP